MSNDFSNQINYRDILKKLKNFEFKTFKGGGIENLIIGDNSEIIKCKNESYDENWVDVIDKYEHRGYHKKKDLSFFTLNTRIEEDFPYFVFNDKKDIDLSSENLDIKKEALLALSVLGFNKSKSEKIVSKLYFENKNIELQELIKRSLNKL